MTWNIASGPTPHDSHFPCHWPRPGGPGIADIARLIRSLPFEQDRRLVGERFYRAFVFNVVAGATDAHAKNYSLMLDGAMVRLAPLYDLATYAAYWDGGKGAREVADALISGVRRLPLVLTGKSV